MKKVMVAPVTGYVTAVGTDKTLLGQYRHFYDLALGIGIEECEKIKCEVAAVIHEAQTRRRTRVDQILAYVENKLHNLAGKFARLCVDMKLDDVKLAIKEFAAVILHFRHQAEQVNAVA